MFVAQTLCSNVSAFVELKNYFVECKVIIINIMKIRTKNIEIGMIVNANSYL